MIKEAQETIKTSRRFRSCQQMMSLMEMWRQIHPLKMPSAVLTITYQSGCPVRPTEITQNAMKQEGQHYLSAKPITCHGQGRRFCTSALLTDICRTRSCLCLSKGHSHQAPARLSPKEDTILSYVKPYQGKDKDQLWKPWANVFTTICSSCQR